MTKFHIPILKCGGCALWTLGFGPWDFLGHWVLEIGHYFSSTLQYASLRNRDQLSIRTSGEA